MVPLQGTELVNDWMSQNQAVLNHSAPPPRNGSFPSPFSLVNKKLFPLCILDQVLEDTPVGAVVMIVSTFDPDDGQGGVIKYSIKDGDEGKFAIDKQTGTVTLAEKLDFETMQKYNLTIQARDKVWGRFGGFFVFFSFVSCICWCGFSFIWFFLNCWHINTCHITWLIAWK